MTFLPVVDRELRLRARRPGTYLVRAAAAGVAILLFSGVAVMQRITGGGQLPGSLLFAILSWTAFVYCLVEGVRATADGLS